jgi:hypothetical protein
MKKKFLLATVFLATSLSSRADIIAGPITNPANGHDYYLLSPNSWTASEAEAEDLGGTLAIVRNADEQKWIYTKFGSNGNAKRSLWIGLHRKTPGGPFFWVDGSPVNYTNWWEGEPNNADGVETCVEMFGEIAAPGTWNDNMDAVLAYGVVEVPYKVQLSEKEKALIGDWYFSGRADQPCHIVAANDVFFVINQWGNTSQMIANKKGLLFLPAWEARAEVIDDKILFSNGAWWSREPMKDQPERSPAMNSQPFPVIMD